MVIAGCLEYNFATSIMFKPENVSPVAERFRGVACLGGGTVTLSVFLGNEI